MKIAPATRFQFREAFRHMHRNIIEGGVAKNPVVKAYKYADAVVKAAMGDLYGVQTFDVLIYGPDHLLNLILAYKASAQGMSVALYHAPGFHPEQLAAAMEQRMGYFHPSFSALIERHLGIEGLGVGLYEVIEQLALRIDSHVGADGEALVYQLDACALFHDILTDQTDCVRCWVEPAPPQHAYPTVERLLFWDQESARRFATENGKFSEHSLEVASVWLTGAPGREMGDIEASFIECFGEAGRPLAGFDYFKGQDRLKDVIDALGAGHE